jgi:endonuclease/exonuclease/phosphatase family metal-dependent hydrolase
MAKKKKSRSGPLRRLFTWLATLLTSLGLGGWAYPDLPVVGKAVQSGWDLVSGEKPLSSVVPEGGLLDGLSAAMSGGSGGAATTQYVSNSPPPSLQPGEAISICSFNIQVFGTSKMQKSDVVQSLVQIVRQFDLVAIQEVRSKDDNLIPSFVQMINSDGHRYHYAIGPRLGRTVSTEQYVFVFNTDRIEIDPNSILTMDDPTDLLHRPPLLARFRARTMDPAYGFTFWMINAHTDPDEVKSEVDALADAFTSVQQRGWGEDDVILLGDLNASETQLGRLGQLPGIRYVISGVPTNTRGTKTYDNILFDGRKTVEFTGQAGVLNMQQMFGISEEQALKISDHQPVWALFSCYENSRGDAILAQQSAGRR